MKVSGMDGDALVEAGLGVLPGLKALLMTGYTQETAAQVLKARDIPILHKPFNLERLCALAAQMTA